MSINGNEFTPSEGTDFNDILAGYLAATREAKRQVWVGLMWWLGSTVAMSIALASTSISFLWFGGAIGAYFHWYRAIVILVELRLKGFKIFLPNMVLPLAIVVVLAAVSSSVIIPEWIKTNYPQVGTCLAIAGADQQVPVACWSTSVDAQIVGVAPSPDNCPDSADHYFPDKDESGWVFCTSAK